jgi:outer membrane protein assembly factor BamB
MRTNTEVAGDGAATRAICAAGLATSAAAMADGTAYQADPAHDGVVTGESLTAPLTDLWSVTLPSTATTPLIAGSTVYDISGGRLEAINGATGAALWKDSNDGFALSYDGGRVFAIDGGGLLTAYDAQTGDVEWSRQLPGQYAFSAAPTASGGFVYVGGAGMGGTLYAVNESTGAVAWTQSVQNGDDSSPAVLGNDVYVTYPGQYYAFNRITGAPVWYDDGDIEGGGGWTPVAADGDLFVRDEDTSSQILSATTGQTAGPLDASATPVVDAGSVYELDKGTLQGLTDDGLGPITWSFAGDGELDTPPLLADGTLWIGSSSGTLYGVDAATGLMTWSTDVGTPVNGPTYGGENDLGLASGNGELIVPAGDTLTAYASSTGLGSTTPPTSTGTGSSGSSGTGGERRRQHRYRARLRRRLGGRLQYGRLRRRHCRGRRHRDDRDDGTEHPVRVDSGCQRDHDPSRSGRRPAQSAHRGDRELPRRSRRRHADPHPARPRRGGPRDPLVRASRRSSPDAAGVVDAHREAGQDPAQGDACQPRG